MDTPARTFAERPPGIVGRQTPWKPSHPAMTSHSSTCCLTLVRIQHTRPLRLDLPDPDVVDIEQQRPSRGEPRLDQVLHDLRLPVHRDRLAPGERSHVDSVAFTRELQLDAFVHEALARHPLSHPRLGEEIDDTLFEHPRADPGFDVLAASVLQDHRLDALEMQQVRQRQAGGPGPDDRNLCSHHAPPSRSNSAACPWPTPMHIVARP